MANILLTRVDNRLVHGQVGVIWTNYLGANLIVVANDEAATDSVQQNLMEMVVPNSVGIRFFSIQKTIDIIHKASDKQKIFIVCKTPQDVLKLIDGGVPIGKINIGNMHYSEGKRKISTAVAVDDNDLMCFRKLVGLGKNVEIKTVPTEKEEINIIDYI